MINESRYLFSDGVSLFNIYEELEFITEVYDMKEKKLNFYFEPKYNLLTVFDDVRQVRYYSDLMYCRNLKLKNILKNIKK